MDNKELIKLIVDHHNGTVAGNYSTADARESIRQALVELNGGSTKLDYRAIRDGKCQGLFTLIEEAVTQTVLEGLGEDNPLFKYVEQRNLAEGDTPIFKVKDNSLFVVADVANGTQALRRQRALPGQVITVTTTRKGIAIYEELDRILGGKVDINELIDKAAQSFEKAITEAMYNGVQAAFAKKATPYKVSGAFAEDKLIELIDHVEATTGKTAVVLGSKQAVRKITGIKGAEATSAKEDLYSMGYYGHIGENPVIAMKNAHKVGTDNFVLDPNKLYVVATDDQFVKFVNEGETLIIPVMPEENADLTQEYKMFAKFGVAVVFADKGAAVYELA